MATGLDSAAPEVLPPPLPPVEGAPSEGKLPVGIKLAYGMPNFAGAAMAIPILVHMNFFYSDVVLVPLGYVALAVAVARAFDAITDPLMGWISDRTRTRWGRRRPWMFVGAPLCAVAFVALFSPPEGMGPTTAATWFISTFTLYFLFHTVYSIPHYGLGPELTFDYRERSSLFAWMEGFMLLGTICAAAIPGLVLIPRFGERTGFTIFACVFAVILTALYWWQCYRIRERPEFYNQQPNPLIPGVRRVMRNRPFRILLASYVVGAVTGAIPALLMPYFVAYVLKPPNPQWWIGLLLLVYFVSAFGTLPAWLWAVKRWGKKPIYVVSIVVGVTAALMLFFQGEGDLLPTTLILVWGGASLGVRIFLGPAIQADVIDYDAFYTGRRREAQYGALWAIMVKFVVIPGAAVPLGILANVGYEPNVEQTETVKFTIRAIYGLAPFAFGTLALLVFLFYPINEDIHRAILEGIEKHKRGEPAEDPLTGQMVPPPSDRGVDEETGWFLDHFSRRELERSITAGPSVMVRGAVRAAAASLGVAALGVGLIVPDLSDLSHRPGASTYLKVVVAGFALSAFLYHAVRWHAARQAARSWVPEEVVRGHLELTARLAQRRGAKVASISAP